MHLNNCKTSWEGFLPTKEVQVAIESILLRLQNCSPSDSFLNISITANADETSGMLTIKSHAIKLESAKTGDTALIVANLLKVDLLAQLKSWASSRTF